MSHAASLAPNPSHGGFSQSASETQKQPGFLSFSVYDLKHSLFS